MEHRDQPDTSNDFLSEFVIGMSDGVIVPFALTVGLSQSAGSALMVATVGTIALSAGAIAMGVGGYLTGKAELSIYKPDSHSTALETNRPAVDEKEEVKTFLANLGIDEELQRQAAEEFTREKRDWAQQMLEKENEKQPLHRPAKTGLNIGLSYAFGGIVPVAPYFFIDDKYNAVKISVVLAVLCLPVLGYLKSRVTGVNPIAGIIRSTATGLLAALGAFLVARLFIV